MAQGCHRGFQAQFGFEVHSVQGFRREVGRHAIPLALSLQLCVLRRQE